MKHLSVDELKRANARHLWHPMASPQASQHAPPDIIVRGEGSWIWDVDGHRLVDGVAGLWSVNVGFGRREIRELAERLVRLMEPDGVEAVFFSNGGSDAVESALKLARQYWKLKGEADRVKFISLRQGYHGVHFGGTCCCR